MSRARTVIRDRDGRRDHRGTAGRAAEGADPAEYDHVELSAELAEAHVGLGITELAVEDNGRHFIRRWPRPVVTRGHQRRGAGKEEPAFV